MYSASSSDESLAIVSTISTGASSADLTFDVQDNQNGEAEITVTVSDEFGRAIDNETFTLTIDPINDAPELSNGAFIEPIVLTEDSESMSVNLGGMFTDIDFISGAEELTYGLYIIGENLFTSYIEGNFIYITPISNQFGIGQIYITAIDSGNLESGPLNLSITIISVNDTPELVEIGNQTTDEDIDLTISLTSTDPDIETDGQSLVYSASSSDESLAIVSTISTGASSADLTFDVQDNQNGEAEITVTVSDEFGRAIDNETFTLTIDPINDAPVITSNPILDAFIGESYTYSITVNDIEDDLFEITSENLPDWLNLGSLGHNYSITGIPIFIGEYPITLIVSEIDGSESNTQNFTITVTSE